MSEILHLYVKGTTPGEHLASTTFGGVQGQETVVFAPSDAYNVAKKQLLERRPGFGLLSLGAQDPVCSVLGSELFSNFFKDSVLAVYKMYRAANNPPRIALHLSRDLYREPWELLRDFDDARQGEFISLIGSIIRFDVEAGGPDPKTLLIPPARSLRCLFISPRPTPTLEQEGVLPIEPEAGTNLVFDIVNPPTFADFNRISDDINISPDGFIFFGHGKVRDSIGHLVFVVMQGMPMFKRPVDDLRSGAAVSGALAAQKKLRFSCLMACETAWMSDKEMSFENTVAGSLLTKTNIGFVLGAQLKLDFYAAQTFLADTLGAVQAGYPLDLAIKVGRKAVRGLTPGSNATDKSGLDWWVPVLYAKSSVFDILAKPVMQLPELTRTI
jgi:hypothetical protein